jgi:uncharacterized protein (TIGR03067 family)
MNWTLLPIATLACLLGADSPGETAKQEKEALQGNWTVNHARRGGKKDASLVDATVIIAGDTFVSKSGETVQARGTWKIDVSKNPWTIDLLYTEGQEKGQRLRGIYTRNKGTWILLFSAPGENRPTSFEQDKEKGFLSLILKAAQSG